MFAVFEHGVEDVASAEGRADEGGVVFIAFIAFAVGVGAADGSADRGKRRDEQCSFEFAVAEPCGLFSAERCPGGSRPVAWCKSGRVFA